MVSTQYLTTTTAAKQDHYLSFTDEPKINWEKA